MTDPDHQTADEAPPPTPGSGGPGEARLPAGQLLPADAANRIRWQGQPDHHEVWYLRLNDPRTRTGFWIRYTLHSAKDGVVGATRLWFVSFVVDGRGGEAARWHDQPLLQPPCSKGPFALELAAGRLTSHSAVGQLQTAEGAIEWDLRWAPHAAPRPLLPQPLHRAAALFGRGLWLTAPIAQLSGMVRVGERRFELERAPGCQAHHWGEQPWRRWTWFHCSGFEDAPDAYLEGLAIRWEKRCPLRASLCSAMLRWDGRLFEMSGLRSMMTSRAAAGADGLYLKLEHPWLRVSGFVETAPDELVQVAYRTPTETVHCRTTGVGRGTLTLEERSRFDRRWRVVATLRADRTFHWESGSPVEDFRVRRKILPAP